MKLALQLGVQVNENNHVVIHPRTKETNIKGVWAGGDLVAHSEQVTISMGDGTQAAIWIHKSCWANHFLMIDNLMED